MTDQRGHKDKMGRQLAINLVEVPSDPASWLLLCRIGP
jgi:hypothetical protein